MFKGTCSLIFLMAIAILAIIALGPTAMADNVDVPYGTTPTLDAFLSPNEWTDAILLNIVMGTGQSTVYLKHDMTDLYIAFTSTIPGPDEIYVDVDHDAASAPQTDDFYIHASSNQAEAYGTGTVWGQMSNTPVGWAADAGFLPIRELRISYSKLDITAGQAKTLGLGLVLYHANPEGTWPSTMNRFDPSTWGNMSASDDWGDGTPNVPPVLSSGSVNPMEATEDDEITFRVMYADADGEASDSPKVFLRNGTNSPEGRDLIPEAGGNPWDVGKWLSLTTTLTPGTWSFRFNATDGADWATGDVDWNPTQVVIGHRNRSPQLSEASLTPMMGDTRTDFTYVVLFRDPDDDAAVTAQVVIDGTPYDMTTISSGPWTEWTLFTYVTNLPEGDSHRFHFSFSDGELGARLPVEDTSPNWMAGPMVERFNNLPLLSGGAVAPASGDRDTTFTFSVTYSDGDGDAPTRSFLYLDEDLIPMTTGSSDFVSGAVYTYSTRLDLGTHSYHYGFNDGRVDARLPADGTLIGPEVINLAPVAVIAEPGDGARYAPGVPVPFSAVGSEDPDGDDLALVWTSDLDGILGTGIGIDVILSEGVHTVTLTVTDELDAVDIASVLVEVRLYLPSLFISDLVHDGTSPIEGDTILITAKVGNDGEADAEGVVVRLFVDGVDVHSDLVTVVVDGETTVSYPWTADEGTHTIRVEAADAHDELSLTVAANNPPTAGPAVEDERKYKPGEQVRFLAEASDADGDALSYVWDFGDGTPVSTDRDPSHVFEQAGTYTISLELSDGRGGTTTATVDVVVRKPKEDESPGFGAALVLLALAVTLVIVTKRR